MRAAIFGTLLGILLGACGGRADNDNIVGLGATCGGYTRNPGVCAPGLTCCAPHAAMDIPGRCVDPTEPNECNKGSGMDGGSTRAIPSLVETCNALDDDLDGVVDQNDVCTRACGADAVADASKTLRLPRAGDQTVAEGSGITPQLLAFSSIPEFCNAPAPSADREDITIGCGEVVVVGGTLRAKAIRIAPGGSLLLGGPTLIQATDVLICPNATIQAGGAPSRSGDGAPGHDLTLEADQLVVLGTMSGAGGFTAARDKRGGDGSRFDIRLRRLLLAGMIDTAKPAPKDTIGGAAGPIKLIVEDESFVSGTIRGGDTTVELPACCHE